MDIQLFYCPKLKCKLTPHGCEKRRQLAKESETKNRISEAGLAECRRCKETEYLKYQKENLV